ncbi:MAG TPA: AraC family transcriptional regulator [Myxococcota bacterium]|nr:AraC family transcriptional regulator [Myxococcota bacterium]
MRADLTINGVWTLWIARGLEALGLDLVAMCSRSGLTASQLRDPDARVPLDALVALWREAERASRDPLVGLHAGERANVSMNHVIALLVGCSRNLRDGLLRALRYENPLLAHGAMGRLEDRGEVFAFAFEDLRGELELPRHQHDFMVASLVRFLSQAAGRELELRAVHLRHPYAGGQSEYERIFGCPVHFGAPANELLIPRRVMLHPLPGHSPGTICHLEAIAEQERQRIGEPAFSDRLRGMLRARLPAEATDADSLAASLHMSVRTLRRRLEDERTCFSDVLDSARRELALERLAEGEPVTIVAQRCGFANARSLVRAFRRWTGETPSAWRARAASRASSQLGDR